MWATAVNHPAGASANSITISNNQHMTVSMTEIQNVSSSVMAPYPWDHHHHLRHNNNQQNSNQEHLVHQHQHHQHQQQQQLDDPSVSLIIFLFFIIRRISWFMDFHILLSHQS